MLTPSSPGHQTNLFGTDLLQQLDRNDPLLRLADAIAWRELDQAFSRHYTQGHGRPAKPIRLMVGLLMLKQLENLSDEALVLQFKRNPYYQAFCGMTEFSLKLPCDSTELVHFRNRTVLTALINSFRSVSGCTVKPLKRTRLTSTRPFRKRTSPIRPMVN